ncbi:BREX-1 system adenine-specific DNA-methyltransferase PglX [Phascolarctobacterium faecium]|uniref:BREX-1 system adenine-specific DNA-methyltransferase PglX n=1 Tax=Phascolarctobacterium faecium TaxID=33025 RepID=UPI003993EAA0
MNKTELKKFAVAARNKLREQCVQAAGSYGLSKDEITAESKQGTGYVIITTSIGTERILNSWEKEQREVLIAKIKKDGFEQVIEEVAYTIFNRLIAIRYMEINGYLPNRLRVLSSQTAGQLEPDLVFYAPKITLPLSEAEKDNINMLKDANKLDEIFKFLFIKECNELGKVLPGLFTPIEGYVELLFALRYTQQDGVIKDILAIPEEEWLDAVQIIGWLYQYYNSEPKDKVFADLKKNIKIAKENIPAATQLFTPDWIVRYMVENSLGRLWLEGHPDAALKDGWKYYLDEAEQEAEVEKQLKEIRKEYAVIKPDAIKCIDPCMGSGHILVYLFDVLMQIYDSCGYTKRDAVRSILENNLYGLDIDGRATQLAYFAVMMKACSYDGRFLSRNLQPHVYDIRESNTIDINRLQYFGASLDELNRNIAITQMEGLISAFKNAKEYGSIISVENYDWQLLRNFINSFNTEKQVNIFEVGDMPALQEELRQLIELGEALAKKYDVVVTNPPYMGSGNMNAKLSDYVKKNYPDSKSDLFAVFIERCLQMANKDAYTAMITQHAWMFLSSYKKLRLKIIDNNLINMAHLGTRAFEEIGGEVVQTTTFVCRKSHVEGYCTQFLRLVDFANQQLKEQAFICKKERHTSCTGSFEKIPNQVFAYWASNSLIEVFNNSIIADFGNSCIGMRTGDNERFLRLWGEVSMSNLGLDYSTANDAHISKKKWFPYCKGGAFRKWYGNNYYVVNWEDDGLEIKENTRRVYPQLGDNLSWKISNEQFYFRKGLTWSGVGASTFGVRSYPTGMIFDSGANSFFPNDSSHYYYFAGLFNTNLINEIIKIINPTINTGCGVVAALPAILDMGKKPLIDKIVAENINISKVDWDSFEISWDFTRQPLVGSYHTVYEAYVAWKSECSNRFNQLKANEEELNRIFIDIYGLQDELTPEVEDKDVTVRKADLVRDIRSFISYAVGCMLGRYSLDVEGLAYAGGKWDASKYTTFEVDNDNIIPITDEDYFYDDIVGRFVDFVKTVYGEETLEQNLQFVADALGGSGLSRDVIRKYFLNGFFSDHCKIYQKRPIYWLFDAGKENSFKALIYLHRYDENTVGKVRVDYLHKVQRKLEEELKICEQLTKMELSANEKAKNTKRMGKIEAQLQEIHTYDEVLAHVAGQRIKLDLDDGVKVNYAKFQNIEVVADDGRKRKVNLLVKI